MAEKSRFSVKFWGVRGSMPTPGTRTIRYGGHTSCVEVRCGRQILIFDAGTGIYALGEHIRTERMDTDRIDIFLSHTHIDHVYGFPFFAPAYKSQHTIHVWAGHLKAEGRNLRDTLSRLMSPPLFPLTLDALKAHMHYHDFEAGEPISCPHLNATGIRVTTLPLNHPDRATAYRVEYQNKSVCYVTDVEHLRDRLDETLIAFIRDATLLIYDSTYDDRDFERHIGWGHSTWQQAVRLADAAGVETLALFHHDHNCSDDTLDNRSEELKSMRPNDRIAREGLVLTLA